MNFEKFYNADNKKKFYGKTLTCAERKKIDEIIYKIAYPVVHNSYVDYGAVVYLLKNASDLYEYCYNRVKLEELDTEIMKKVAFAIVLRIYSYCGGFNNSNEFQEALEDCVRVDFMHCIFAKKELDKPRKIALFKNKKKVSDMVYEDFANEIVRACKYVDLNSRCERNNYSLYFFN